MAEKHGGVIIHLKFGFDLKLVTSAIKSTSSHNIISVPPLEHFSFNSQIILIPYYTVYIYHKLDFIVDASTSLIDNKLSLIESAMSVADTVSEQLLYDDTPTNSSLSCGL